MKLNYKSYPTFNRHRIFFASILFLALTATVNIRAQSDDEKSVADNVKPEDIIASARANNIDTFEKVSGNFATQRKALGAELVNLLKNTKSSNLNRCCAAYYLGEMRFQEAADILAANIALNLDTSRISIDHLPTIKRAAAMNALIKIGSPSIPAVIYNLAESDDAKVRELSLQVLVQIDNDKDITQLRLQKTIKAEADSQKQARLQMALKALAETK